MNLFDMIKNMEGMPKDKITHTATHIAEDADERIGYNECNKQWLTFLSSLEIDEDKVYFLNWIADRIVNVYGESENVDFVIKLREICSSKIISTKEKP